MKVTVIGVGKLKEKYWRDAIDEYSKRLGRYVKLEVIEVADEKVPETLSPAQEEQVKKSEGGRILKNIRDKDYVIALAIDGKSLSSEEFSAFVSERMNLGEADMVFVIGGSLGLSADVLKRADFKLSFSKMTFPHQMMRVILLEQIYRSFKIINRETYHK